MHNFKTLIVLLLLGCQLPPLAAQQQERYPFENQVIVFRDIDRKAPPEPGGTLFIGSSSIRRWVDLERRFAGANIIRRGLGGCQLADVVEFYMDSVVYPYKANKVFVYAGENDIANGKSPEEVAATFEQLYKLLLRANPDVRVYFLSIKPSNRRLKLTDSFVKANQLIERFLGDQENGEYIDMGTVLMGKDGKPDNGFFAEDRLHLNAAGYDLWEAIIRPYVIP
ncbi:Lysophospholipase L1 [Parapedobacter composti]|uniref:Lysophospholipase L1 n=1 Tax=Parapedobacter composti TaxID=623281 RepID=A0A1I1EBB4_9SPHI|nr:GDSL-type esterase/lipase family protein [Parapedobacter composti]SFB83892.1 Lysophospholipase L1 [Parapedobacter composti]